MELARWFAYANCEMCIELYDGKENAPCQTCRPVTHKFNIPVVTLYLTCQDQMVMGFSGPVGLNDIAIGHAMNTYFEVEKSDRLELSLAVRSFFRKVLEFIKEKADGNS
ncbi:hypothetical protein JT06_15870 [Desulfobulbus sp. Tol-SR]|jgi:hypothetical protein|nr:hypothetical protein JT06_15870 [Desulfobulbus sp. Tol-SR]